MEKTSIFKSCYKCGQIVRKGHDIGYALNEHWNNYISCKRESIKPNLNLTFLD